MADKTTAFALEIASTTLVSQAIILRDGTVARRTLDSGQVRTQWKITKKADPKSFIVPFIDSLIGYTAEGSAGSPQITLAAVIEVAPDEVTELDTMSFPRNLGLRFARVKERANEADGY